MRDGAVATAPPRQEFEPVAAHWGPEVVFGPAMKHDVQREATEVHDYGHGGWAPDVNAGSVGA